MWLPNKYKGNEESFLAIKKSLKAAEEPNIKLLKRPKRKNLNHVMESMLELKSTAS